MKDSRGYPPFDVPKAMAPDLWIVDGRPVRAGGIPLPVRMSVMRLPNGDLLLHSPIAWSRALQMSLEAFGSIRHLIAPSIGHWMFLKDWQAACPSAKTWAVPGLAERSAVRKAGIRIDANLEDKAPPDWDGDISQVLMEGVIFKEVAFFHRTSKTLILTDVVLNIEASKLPLLARPVARVLGVLAPHGRAPAYVRFLIGLNRAKASRAAQRLIAFEPQLVLFSHGRPFTEQAVARLRQSLDWLL